MDMNEVAERLEKLVSDIRKSNLPDGPYRSPDDPVSDHRVWDVRGGTRSHITSPEDYNRLYDSDWSRIQSIPWSTLSAIPEAENSEPTICLNVQSGGALSMLEHVKAMNVRHVRTSWWTWSLPSDWDWLPHYPNAGIEVMPVLYTGLGWLPVGERYDALRAFSPALPWVQLDNEADAEGADYYMGREHGEYHRREAERIKSRDPGTKICGMGMGWTQPGVHDYIRGYIQTAGDLLDAFSIHIYGQHPYGEPMSRWKHVRDAGWKGEIWSTELGQSDAYMNSIGATRSMVDAYQEESWRIALSGDKNRYAYGRIYGFQLTPDHEGYGILRPDLSYRPAANWMVSR